MNKPKSPFQPYERIGTTGGLPGGERVQKRVYAPALVLLGAAAVALVLIGWWFFAGDDEVQAGPGPEHANPAGIKLDSPQTASKNRIPGPVANPDGAPLAKLPTADDPAATPTKAQNESPRSQVLAQPIERIIARWMKQASQASKGKVTASNTVVAVHVRDLEGRVWLARNAQDPLLPASNLKLLTCATAAILAGPDAHFETHFDALGEIQGGVLRGDLVVRAGADPLFDAEADGSIERWLKPLAEQLKQAGIQRVTGRLVLDEGDYLAPGPGPAWPDDREHWKESCALSGGFNANAGCLTSAVRATQVGQDAAVVVRPAGHGLSQSKGTVKTVARGKPLDVRVGAMPRLVVKGSLPANYSKTSYVSRFAHPDPVDLFGHAIWEGLRQHGVQIAKEPSRERNAQAGRRVATLRTPILETFEPILLDSNNAVADQLLWWLGHTYGGRGDRTGGSRAVAQTLARLGVDPEGWLQVDGSGLSKNNRVRADQMTAVLAGVLLDKNPATDEFLRGLPIAGQTGTLRRRMKEGPASGNVRAKTGFVNGASALSGQVRTARGQTLVFSILVRYPYAPSMNSNVFKPMQDEICQLLAGWEVELE